MSRQTEVRDAIRTCIAIEQSGGDLDGNRLTDYILKCLKELGVVIKTPNVRQSNVEYPVAVEPLVVE